MRTIELQFKYKDIEHIHNEYTAKLSNIKAMDTWLKMEDGKVCYK